MGHPKYVGDAADFVRGIVSKTLTCESGLAKEPCGPGDGHE